MFPKVRLLELEQALGKDGAKDFLQDLYDAKKAGDAALKTQNIAKFLGKYVLGGGAGLDYRLRNPQALICRSGNQVTFVVKYISGQCSLRHFYIGNHSDCRFDGLGRHDLFLGWEE